MNLENYNKELTAFRDRVLELLKNNAAKPSGIMICVDKALPGLIAEYRKTVPRETVMLYLYPPCSPAEEFSMNSSIPPGEMTLVSSLEKKACSKDKAGVLVSLLSGRKVNVSVSAEIEGPFHAELSEIKKAVGDAIFNAAQSSAARMVYLRDSIKNLPFILRDCGNQINIMPENIPAVICSAGPSMAEAIPILKKYSHGLLVIAVGRVVPSLVEAGIIPDFIVDIDPNKSWVKCHMKIDSIPVASVSVRPNPDFEYSKTVWTYGDSQEFNKIIKDMDLKLYSIALSKTVTASALDFALTMGVRAVAMTGSDLCLSASGDYHAVNKETDKAYNKEMLFEIDGNNGKKVLSTPMLNSLKEALEVYAFYAKEKYEGLKIFNCAENGALVRSLEKKDFESFCVEFAADHKKVELVENQQIKTNINIAVFRDSLSTYISVIEDLLETARRLEREIKNSITALDKIRDLQENLRKLGEKERQIRTLAPFNIIAAAVQEQIDDFINEMPFSGKAALKDAAAQIKEFRKRYILIRDLSCDLKSDFNKAIEKISGNYAVNDYYFRDFSCFRQYAVSFIKNENRELADFLSGYKASEIREKYFIISKLQNLPSVALIQNNGEKIYLNDTMAMENVAEKDIEKFIGNSKFSSEKNLVIFFAPGNWIHVKTFAEKFPDADIIVVEIWLDLFYHIIGQSMFFNKLPEKTLVVGIHENLKNSRKILMRAIGESAKKPLFFENPGTWKLEEVRKLFEKTFDGFVK